MVASPYAKSIRPMQMGQPSLSSQIGRPNVSSGIMGTPSLMRQMYPSQPGNANVIKSEDIRSQYDMLKKEAADRRSGGFMWQVVLPTEGQTFEEY